MERARGESRAREVASSRIKNANRKTSKQTNKQMTYVVKVIFVVEI